VAVLLVKMLLVLVVLSVVLVLPALSVVLVLPALSVVLVLPALSVVLVLLVLALLPPRPTPVMTGMGTEAPSPVHRALRRRFRVQHSASCARCGCASNVPLRRCIATISRR
jgi:hypothetical protein